MVLLILSRMGQKLNYILRLSHLYSLHPWVFRLSSEISNCLDANYVLFTKRFLQAPRLGLNPFRVASDFLYIYLCMYSFSCKEKQNFNHSVIFGPKVKVNNKTIFRLRSAFSVLVKFSKLNFLVVTASCWVAKNKSCPNNIKRKYIRPRHKTDSLAILKW